MFPADEVADVFAVVGVVPTLDLRLDPIILLVRQSTGLVDSRRCGSLAAHHWYDNVIDFRGTPHRASDLLNLCAGEPIVVTPVVTFPKALVKWALETLPGSL